eukprot:gene1514-12640_t
MRKYNTLKNLTQKIVFHSKDESDTSNLGIFFSKYARKGDSFLLDGDLSAGKSIFSRGFIQNLHHEKINITSPTFMIENIYQPKNVQIHHIDLYRIEEEIDLYRLNWSEISKGISLIEWSSKLENLKEKLLISSQMVNIEFKLADDEIMERFINISIKDEYWKNIMKSSKEFDFIVDN